MTVSIDQEIVVAPDAFLLKWSSTESDPRYRVFRDGLPITGLSRANNATFTVAPDQSSLIQVLDDPDEIPAAIFAGEIVLTWPSAAGTREYRVEKFIAGNWEPQTRIADTGRDSYTWRSDTLQDATAHNFRVIAVGEDGNESTPSTFDLTMLRNPDDPKASITFSDATKAITVTI